MQPELLLGNQVTTHSSSYLTRFGWLLHHRPQKPAALCQPETFVNQTDEPIAPGVAQKIKGRQRIETLVSLCLMPRIFTV